MSLTTNHIGWAIRDFMEGREIEGERASSANPFAEEKEFIEHIDCSDPSNPMIFTSAGTFKLIILRVDAPPHYVEPAPKLLPKIVKGSLEDQ